MNIDETLNLILERLTALEAKSYDTRPMHDQTRAEIIEMRLEMNQRFERLEKEMRLMNRRFDEVGRDQYTLRAEVRDLEQRVDDIERPRQ